jgi:hypothetical protein
MSHSHVISHPDLISNTHVIVICAGLLVLVAAIMWRRGGAIGPRERVLYDFLILVGVGGLAARTARLAGQTWFSAPFTRLDNAVWMAALVLGFILAFSAYTKLPQSARTPGLGRFWVSFYAIRNVFYFSIPYVLLTAGAEDLLRAEGLAADLPIEILKGTILAALAGYAAYRVARGFAALVRWAQAGGPSAPARPEV